MHLLRISRWATRLLIFAWLLPSVGVTAAQSNSEDDLMSLEIEDLARIKVFSASRHLEDARKAPAAFSIITREEIDRYGWRTLADILRSVRGFYTAYDRNYTYVGVRGFLQSGDYNARILLLINGHRINENVYDSALIGTEFPLDIDLIDHVEVVRGASSSVFGTNGELGVINVVTRRPREPLAVEAAGDTGSFMERQGRVTGSFEAGQVSGLISGSMYRSQGASPLFFSEFASPATDNGLAENMDGDSSSQVFADVQRGKLRLQGLYGRRRKQIPTASYGTTFNDPSNWTSDTRAYLDVSYSWELGTRTVLDVRSYYDAYRFLGSYAYRTPGAPDRSVQMNDAEADWSGVEAVLGRKLGRHRLVLGTSAEYNLRIEQKNYYLGQSPFLDDTERPWLLAGFGEVELNFTSKVTLNAGGRIDHYDLFGTSLSPRVALVYLPNAR
ncbi:MAG: TonB-dependent receptor, partial [Acidobacteriales bacterium]|nr:TonB-dependent receptor [Terriglobales bacterium]